MFHAFSSSVDLFSKSTFSNNPYKNAMRVSSGFDPDKDQLFVGPDLGLNC